MAFLDVAYYTIGSVGTVLNAIVLIPLGTSKSQTHKGSRLYFFHQAGIDLCASALLILNTPSGMYQYPYWYMPEGVFRMSRAVGCPEISLFRCTIKHSWAPIPFGLITDHAKFQIDTPMAWFLELDLKKLTFEQYLLLFTDFAERSSF